MSFVQRSNFLWKLRTRSLQLGEQTRLMAVINLTPDSFSGDGLSPAGIDAAIRAATDAVDAGADIIDLGAESTRPGAEPITSATEHRRLLPVLEGLLKQRPSAIVSVDTYHGATALEAAQAGAEIINDVSGLTWDSTMAEAVVATRCGLVLMHTRGRPADWPSQPPLPDDRMLANVRDGLREQLVSAQAAGVALPSIVLDPGFGFGKRGRENFTLLASLPTLREFACPLMAGVSRKGFLGEAVHHLQPETLTLAESRRTPTIAANVAAILAGAHLLRVHELQPAREAAAIADALLQ